MRSWVIFILGTVVGIALAVVVARGMATDKGAAASAAQEPSPAPAPTVPLSATALSNKLPPRARLSLDAAGKGPGALLAPPPQVALAPPAQADTAKVHAELEATRQALEKERAERAQVDGAPLPAPPGLAQRFSAEAIRPALDAALREAGFANAQVTSLDCTEYPCIAYGEGMGSRDDFQKLKGTGAYAPYVNDTRAAFGWAIGSGEKKKQYFGVALYPADDGKARGEALMKRLKYRTDQMRQTFAP